jgi:hypothetical protein
VCCSRACHNCAGLFADPPPLLKLLEAANCSITGALPPVPEASPLAFNLRRVDVRANNLSGPMHPTWANLSSLACLQLSQNPGLCGAIPDNIVCFDTGGTSLGEFRRGRCAVVCTPIAYRLAPAQPCMNVPPSHVHGMQVTCAQATASRRTSTWTACAT